jgi:hypothetical protein
LQQIDFILVIVYAQLHCLTSIRQVDNILIK